MLIDYFYNNIDDDKICYNDNLLESNNHENTFCLRPWFLVLAIFFTANIVLAQEEKIDQIVEIKFICLAKGEIIECS